MNILRNRMLVLLLVAVVVLLAACGTPSKEDVVKKLSGKWNDAKGYELQATMEIKTGAEPRMYDVEVWHTKPDFYRVNVTQEGSGDSQMIVRNENGVFVVAPSLGKTYKFQSDWPEQNSQGYLMGALAEDIKEDSNAVMTEEDKTYIFETETRNNHKKVLPTQEIHIDKKTLLPKHVSILDENKEEKIRITFKKIELGTERKTEDYAVDPNTEEQKPEKSPKADLESEEESDEESNSESDDESESEEEAREDEEEEEEDGEEQSDEEASLNPHYPTVQWDGVTLIDEESVKTANGPRVFMTFGDTKKYTIIQEKSMPAENTLAVSVEGDPVDLGFTVAALTDQSLRWESEGISFFIASDTLSPEEMIEVALSMTPGEMK